MNDYGASHWSSGRVWDRRKLKIDAPDHGSDRRFRKAQDNTTPYMISFHFGEEEKEWLEAIRNNLSNNEIDEDTNWQNNSILLRRIIKLAYVFSETMKGQKTLQSFKEEKDAEKI